MGLQHNQCRPPMSTHMCTSLQYYTAVHLLCTRRRASITAITVTTRATPLQPAKLEIDTNMCKLLRSCNLLHLSGLYGQLHDGPIQCLDARSTERHRIFAAGDDLRGSLAMG